MRMQNPAPPFAKTQDLLESQEGLKQVALEVGKYFGCGELESQEGLKRRVGDTIADYHVYAVWRVLESQEGLKHVVVNPLKPLHVAYH
jgi:hypothetical protein